MPDLISQDCDESVQSYAPKFNSIWPKRKKRRDKTIECKIWIQWGGVHKVLVIIVIECL